MACDPWDDIYWSDYRALCGSFMDVWGPYIWVALAIVALVIVAVALNRRHRPPATASSAPTQHESTNSAPAQFEGSALFRAVAFLVVGLLLALALLLTQVGRLA